MARLKQTFHVNAPLNVTWKVYSDPKSLIALTPPPVQVKIVHLDEPLAVGSHLIFRLGIGPIGVLWDAVYDEFDPWQPGLKRWGFVDRSAKGPFQFWVHRHIFEELADGTSMLTDDASFELFLGPVGKIITWIVAWPAIDVMFLYRRMKTYQLVKRNIYANQV